MTERPYPTSPATSPAPRVVYIGGTGRTGSTLLTRLLGEIPGWFAGGELAFLWDYGLRQGGRCTCGESLTDCEIWSQVWSRLAEWGIEIDAERMVADRRRCWSAHLPVMAVPGVADRLFERLGSFPDVVEAVYRALAQVTGARVIVDSSKEPHYSWILRDRTDLDLRFVQLVRDPRAVAHSWQRKRLERGLDGDEQMETRGPLRSSLYYGVSNIAAEAIWRSDDNYRFVRYEDFVADPDRVLNELVRFADGGMQAFQSPLDGHEFVTSPSHMAWGNPNRFDGGKLRIKPDNSWRSPRVSRSSTIAGAASAVLARRYGYRIRSTAPGTVVSKLEAQRIPRRADAPGTDTTHTNR